jgi:hypothetical protein
LRERITPPIGRCATTPCQGLNVMPSSMAAERASFQAGWGATRMRATAT